jgi:hypothetical protein
MASIIVEQKIFDEVRIWIKTCSVENPSYIRKKLCQLISCMFCTGYWSGVFISFIFNVFLLGFPFDQFLSGLLGAVFAYVLHILVGMLEFTAHEKYNVDI